MATFKGEDKMPVQVRSTLQYICMYVYIMYVEKKRYEKYVCMCTTLTLTVVCICNVLGTFLL